ncbi:hypothetical protein [Ferrovibrio sp.]|uniref:hypothetical protein n=1 Tax=Ferrovibrio sp. TaxID=1917215 RepID=UPI003D1003CF
MTAKSLHGVAGYLPLLRFEQAVAKAELRWAGLGGAGKGRRAVAGWDEDALTQAVEAARLVLPADAAKAVTRVTFASTSAAFTDRSQAGILVDALQFDRGADALDVAGSRRGAVAALSRALRGAAPGAELIAAGEKRVAQPGSMPHLAWGDGGAAAIVGDGPGIARLLGAASINADLLDSYTSAGRGLPYVTEERFVRDSAVADIYVPVIKHALGAAKISGADIAYAIVPEPVGGTYAAAARTLGLKAPNICDEIAVEAGELGAAMPLFGLGLALERAAIGDRVLLVGFGNGAEVLVLEVTAASSGQATSQMLGNGQALRSYSRFLSLTGMLPLEWGPRAEVNQKTNASVLARHGRDMHGFVGGRDARGNVQFPKTPMPVSPEATGPESYEDVVLRDVPAKVASITADRLNFTPDPPFYFGLVQFENGARVAMEICDVEGATPAVGDPLRMRFRIKAIDRQRDFRTYFWKGAPANRPQAAGEGA